MTTTGRLAMIYPVTITAAEIVSTDVPVDDTYSEWAVGTGYVEGDIVWKGERRYIAVQASTGEDPAAAASVYWSDYGAATRYRPFDRVLGAFASRATSLNYRLEVDSFCPGLGLFDVNGGDVQIEIWNASAVKIYDQTFSLRDESFPTDFLDLLTRIPEFRNWIVLDGLPLYAGYQIRITIDAGTGGTARLGEVALGRVVTLGRLIDYELELDDYSQLDRNDFGEILEEEILERAAWTDATYRIEVEKFDSRRVLSEVADRRAAFTVFYMTSGTVEDGMASAVMGVPRRVRAAQQRGRFATITIPVRGIT